MKLNVGSGGTPLDGYIPVDRKLGGEAYPLAYADGTADEIRASHVLEHFDWDTVPKVLADWFRVLKPGGVLKVAVPNMRWVAEHLDNPMSPRYLMGGQTDENDYHKSAFTLETLSDLLKQTGFKGLGVWASEIRDCASLPVSLNLSAVKPAGAKATAPADPAGRVVAVMSMPRLAFSDNMYCAVESFVQLGIPMTKVTGAFWGQCLERGMVMAAEDGAEWILTVDYDTVFTPDTLRHLLTLMAEHPEADAIAPIQIRREEDYALVTIEDESGRRVNTVRTEDLQKPLLRVATAHFGLTLFRVSALRKMPHPWFLGEPNAQGEWGEGRTDDDIYFWRKWKEAGNSLFLANGTPVGHLQLMVTWPDAEFRPVHQYVSKFHRDGPPVPRRSPLAPARVQPAAPGLGFAGKVVTP